MSTLTLDQKRRLLKFFVPSIEHHPSWPVIVSEGDSWSSFPLYPNTVDKLDRMAKRRLSLLRLEKSGDRALRIIGGKQKAKLANYLSRYPVQALLFSGGGNDIVGEDLLPLLKQREAGMSWRQCLDQDAVDGRLDALRAAYLDLVRIRDEARPDCVLYVHGYDYAIPSGIGVKIWFIKVGPWMRPYLLQKGITDPEDGRRIIRELIRQFNQMIAEVATRPRIVYVKTPGTLADEDWHDELHPTRRGFEKIAAKFATELNRQFPGRFAV